MKQYREIDITKINMTPRELMRKASKTHKDETYLTYVQRRSEDTFGQFEEKVNKISNLLVENYGVKQRDKVCTMSENIPELLYLIMAITNIGAIWVPINSMLVGESMKYIIENSNAAFVCATEKYKVGVEEILGGLKQPVKLLPVKELSEQAKDMSQEFECPAQPDDPSMIIFTSGTTGFPKGVIHTHNSFIRSGVRGLEALETTSEDRVHVFLPFFHGWAYLLMLGTLYFKCMLILEDRFHADNYWETIDKYKITQDNWTGTVPLNLMKLPETEYDKKVRIRVVGTFGALYEAMNKRWPNICFQSLFGQTEHPYMTEVPPDQIYPGSDGVPKAPDEILILDNDGNKLPVGEVGEIICRCKCGVLMKGYYNNPEATAKTLKGDDIYTGDLGFLDERGHLHFVGRKKDALRVRGEMVSVEHIEHLINENHKISESAIVGYRPPDKVALKEDEIIAYLVLKADETMTGEEFFAWSEKNLARFMRPRYIVFRNSLPKTATERVQRFKLREEGIKDAIKLF